MRRYEPPCRGDGQAGGLTARTGSRRRQGAVQDVQEGYPARGTSTDEAHVANTALTAHGGACPHFMPTAKRSLQPWALYAQTAGDAHGEK